MCIICTTVTDVYIIYNNLCCKSSCISGLCRCIMQYKGGAYKMVTLINTIFYSAMAGVVVAIPLVLLVCLYMLIRKLIHK